MAKKLTETELRAMISQILDEKLSGKTKKDCCPSDKEGKKMKENPKDHAKKQGKSKYKDLSDEELMEALIASQLKETTTTADGAVSPGSVEDVEEDTTPVEDVQEEEVNLEEARNYVECVLEEAFEADDSLEFPNFKKTIWIVENVFGVKIPEKYNKILEGVYKEKVGKIISENNHKDDYERLI